MTQKTVVECDWHRCDETSPAFDKEDKQKAPTDWAVLITASGSVRHYCPVHMHRAIQWCSDGISKGQRLDVKHEFMDDRELESVNVHAGTHGMHIAPFIDEPPTTFEEFDPPLGTEDQDTEAWGFHVFDHLHVLIIGSHKSDPRVIVRSDEFLTKLEVHDTEGSFEVLTE